MGSVRRRGGIFWIRYYRDGRRYEESSGSRKEGEAKRLLRLREGDVARGVPITPRVGRIRFEEAAKDALNDYRVNGKRSLRDQQRRIEKHLVPFFRGRRMAAITTDQVRAFIAHRQAQARVVKKARRIKKGDIFIEIPEVRRSPSNGEINRELTALKRMFSLAVQAGKLLYKPYIPMLQEDNVRTGFFDREQFGAVRQRLPEDLRPVATFTCVTGWRILSEVLPLQWRQVDFQAGEVRLDPGATKNREGRVFPMTSELRTLLETQRARTQLLQRTRQVVCPWVFHRDGKQVRSMIKAWRTACREAGYPGRLMHDLRRTAVRNLVRAGVPERVAMQMTGHKTRSVFERYNIVSESDLHDAARRLDAVATAARS